MKVRIDEDFSLSSDSYDVLEEAVDILDIASEQIIDDLLAENIKLAAENIKTLLENYG